MNAPAHLDRRKVSVLKVKAASNVLKFMNRRNEQAHTRGLKVVPYTFRSAEVKDFANVKEEMRHYLYELGTDGMFTDNPDQFPRQK